ncbi:hypothetical protein HPB48_013792 [Haemaphysalis longicornis]|uniref:RRM domain-containing protein n=1 Tax=Haemaphysalis longicornis TaxID=44386 RepID=A0A9J6GZ01_HAELO|nr:hypothetical protein HPB48_013792 [Haemaphysalis longicornis]
MNTLALGPLPVACFDLPSSTSSVCKRGTRPMRPTGAVTTLSPACIPPDVHWPFHCQFSTPDSSNVAGATRVFLRGLPYQGKTDDILAIFRGFPYLTTDCVYMRRKPNGRPNGNLMVAFPSRAGAERAVKRRQLCKMGKRYIKCLIAGRGIHAYQS